jgi:hypothetical protein
MVQLSLRVTLCPLASRLVVRFAFVQELLRDGAHQRIVLRAMENVMICQSSTSSLTQIRFGLRVREYDDERETRTGLASVNSEQMDNKTLEIVNAGDHCSFKISRQICPELLTLQW